MAFLDDQRLLETDLRGVHDAGRRDQADDERKIERPRPGDGKHPAGGDRISSATHDAVSDGVAAWSRLRERARASWTDWVAVGRALIIGRTEALKIAETNSPVGSRYNAAMGAWLMANGLDGVNNQERYRALLILENLTAISAWRAGLDEVKRRRLNHPSAIWAHWRRSTKPAEPPRQKQRVVEDASPGEMVDRVHAAAEATRRGKPIYWSQAALRRAHEAMLGCGSNDLLVLARAALQGAIRCESDLLALLEPEPKSRQQRTVAMSALPPVTDIVGAAG